MIVANPLDQSVDLLKMVGKSRRAAFEEVGLHSIRDLIYYFPSKHLDRSNLVDSGKARVVVGSGYDGEITIIGKVIESETIRYFKREIFKVKFSDRIGFFEAIWFQGIKFFKDRFKPGEIYAVSAKPTLTRYGSLQFVHPDFDRFSEKENEDFRHTGKIIPFYRIPARFKKTNLGILSLRNIIYDAVTLYVTELSETLSDQIITKNKLSRIQNAVRSMHFPASENDLKSAIYRFKYEELLYLELLVAGRKHKLKSQRRGIAFNFFPEPIRNFIASLPFKLTEAQLKVLSEIRKDMEADEPMNRLLQGDVGSGKTVVSLIAMLVAITNGYQAVLMAPTEILAHQHFSTISRLLENSDLKMNILLLLGGQSKKIKDQRLEEIGNGRGQIIIGTHALFEEKVGFSNLGLVIIDEQHRFGVEQRARLIMKGLSPDVLAMTATPIPRSLTMTLYGDFDISVIDRLPEGRKKIITKLTPESKLPEVYKFLLDRLKKGDQSYIVYPLIEESEKLELKAAQDHFESLQKTWLKDIRLGLIHGRMKWNEKADVMRKFAEKEFDVLISTTVIEVGIDVKDANIIVINDAFRFGLSQLHQLRGRVGRGERQGYCVLIAGEDFIRSSGNSYLSLDFLSSAEIEKNKTAIRLKSMVDFSDGFRLSEIDLKLRGPGDIFGTKQSGLPTLQFADITQDHDILVQARKDAFAIIADDPKLEKPENGVLKETLIKQYRKAKAYSQIG